MITCETLDFNTKKTLKKEINKILKKEGVLLSLNEYTYTPFYYHLIQESKIIKDFSYQYKADETILNILEKEYKHIFTSMHAIFYKNKQKLYNFLKNDYKDFDSEEEKRSILKQLRY
ncbi:hypothetical protein [uncultured Brachyspira sp.]|uniref:hypothetical protein n=1 Tax=uncultured Brachyspira sp. TaxID=221953 RepID=UPI00261C99C2|nr:hypothetical protein [uncultured Brachyspira sp.]